MIQPVDSVYRVFDLRERKHAPWQREAHQFHMRERLGSVGVALLGQGAALHAAYAADYIQSGGEGSGGVPVLRNMAQKFPRVQMAAESARRRDYGDIKRGQLADHVLDKLRRL
jgi:hypothetical protein